MKKIKLSEYNSYMGILIDVRNELSYKDNPIPGSINIPKDKLLLNYKSMLDKNKTYYIYCKNGVKSGKVVRLLEYFGYDVTQVES